MKLCKKIISAAAIAALTAQCIPYAVFADSEQTVRVIIENTAYTNSSTAWSGTLVDEEVAFDSTTTYQSAVEAALEKHGYTLETNDYGYGTYISAVGGLAEYDGGSSSGWNVFLNDWYTSNGISSYTAESGTLEAGDELTLRYSCSWGADLDYDYMSSASTLLKDLKFSNGTLDKDFDSDTTEYTLTLDDYSDSVIVTPTAANKAFQVKTYKNTYAPEDDGSEYKRTEAIEVTDGDKLYIGIGNSAWESSYYGEYYGGDTPVETVYTITIKSEKLADDNEAASEVIELIGAIGTVTAESGNAVTAARTAYDRLTENQKALVTNLDVLTAAESAYAELTKQTEEEKSYSFDEAYTETGKYLASGDVPTVSSIGGEWTVLGLARSGLISDEFAEGYYENAVNYVKENGSAKLSSTRSTDNSRVILALNSLGYDASDIAGYNLYEPLKDTDYVTKQGLNGAMWALIAGNSSDYTLSNEAELKALILKSQLSDGSWGYDGENGDIDFTAMAVTSLSAYYDDTDIKTAVGKALDYLSEKQSSDGGFGSCETTAQVLTALSSVGVDGASDERFVKADGSVCTALAAYYAGDGLFVHQIGSDSDRYATEQAYYAMTAYYRMTKSQTSLFDMSDVENKTASSTEVSSQEASSKDSSETSSTADKDNDKSPDTGAGVLATGFAILFGAAITVVKKKNG